MFASCQAMFVGLDCFRSRVVGFSEKVIFMIMYVRFAKIISVKKPSKTPWPYSASEPNNHRLSAKLVPTFADRGYRVVSATDPYGRNLCFLDLEETFRHD
jgi:hypothetical protein